MIVNDEVKAFEVVNQLDKTFLDNTFCPLVNGMCNEKCICFQRGKYIVQKNYKEDENDAFIVYGPQCNNRMFYGVD